MVKKLLVLTVLFCAVTTTLGEYKLQTALSSPDSANLDNYGRCVSIDENTAIICADNPSDSNSLIYVYKLNSLDWEYEDSLILPNPQTSFELGETDRACIIGDSWSLLNLLSYRELWRWLDEPYQSPALSPPDSQLLLFE